MSFQICCFQTYYSIIIVKKTLQHQSYPVHITCITFFCTRSALHVLKSEKILATFPNQVANHANAFETAPFTVVVHGSML